MKDHIMYLSWYTSNSTVPEYKPLSDKVLYRKTGVILINDRGDEDQLPPGLVLAFVCLQKQTLNTKCDFSPPGFFSYHQGREAQFIKHKLTL